MFGDRRYSITNGPQYVTYRDAVAYMGCSEAFDVAFQNGYIEDHPTQQEN